MSLKSALARVDRAIDRMGKRYIKETEKQVKNRQAGDDRALENSVLAELAITVRRMLTANLRAKGIRERSGRLQAAIAGANVWIRRSRGKVDLMIGFKSGLDKSVYVYGAALNYGAVRQKRTNLLSPRTKKALKRDAAKGKPASGGGISVLKPRNFFQLTPGQMGVIQALYDKRMQEMRAKRQTRQAA